MIYDSSNLDIFAVRKDGGADLVIVSSGPLDDSATTQTLLLDKIENYLNFIQNESFRKECPNATKNNIHIILRLEERPSHLIGELIKRISEWVDESGAVFSVEWPKSKD